MRPFRSVTSRALVLDRPDVDTDQIIPKQFLKRIERTGYGEFLFFDWMKDPDFELHRFPGASILIAEQNARKVLRMAHHCYVLENGAVAFDGPASELLHDPRIEKTYLGAGH